MFMFSVCLRNHGEDFLSFRVVFGLGLFFFLHRQDMSEQGLVHYGCVF